MPSAALSRLTRSKSDARVAYDRLSRWYDLVADSEARFRDAGLRLLGARDGERVLEIGPGTGHSLVALARAAGEMGQVYGLDLSPGMLRVARARLERAGLAGRVNLVCGDAASLPFPPAAFGAILMSFTLELFDTPEIPMVLDGCRRVLRPGGRICVVALSKENNPTLATRLYEWAHRTFPRYADCRPIFVEQALEEAGFCIIAGEYMTMWGLPVRAVAAQSAKTVV